jgi:hypothetical protein
MKPRQVSRNGFNTIKAPMPSLITVDNQAIQQPLSGLSLTIPDNDIFSYPCAGCDREKTHNCKEERRCQLYMLWNLMSVFEQ